MKRPRLVPDWRRAWRWHSIRLAGVLALLSMLQTDVLPILRSLVPPQHWPWVTLFFALAIGLMRLLAQRDPEDKP